MRTYTKDEVDQMRVAIRASLPASVNAYNPERAEMMLQSYLIAGVSPDEVCGVEPMPLLPSKDDIEAELQRRRDDARDTPIETRHEAFKGRAGKPPPTPPIEPGWYLGRHSGWSIDKSSEPVRVAPQRNGELYVERAGSGLKMSIEGWEFEGRLGGWQRDARDQPLVPPVIRPGWHIGQHPSLCPAREPVLVCEVQEGNPGRPCGLSVMTMGIAYNDHPLDPLDGRWKLERMYPYWEPADVRNWKPEDGEIPKW